MLLKQKRGCATKKEIKDITNINDNRLNIYIKENRSHNIFELCNKYQTIFKLAKLSYINGYFFKALSNNI